MALTITNTITNGIAADGNNLGTNFSDIKTYADANDVLVAANTADLALRSSTVLERTTDISVNNNVSSVTWETETDPDGWWSSGSTITCPADGVYAVAVEFKLTTSGYVYAAFMSTDDPYDNALFTASNPGPYTDFGNLRSSEGGVFYLRSGQTFVVKVGETNAVAENIENVVLTIVRLA